MNIILWAVAGLLAATFLATGLLKVARSKEQIVGSGLAWAEDFPPAAIKLIGVAELLGALGLVLPALFGIAPILVPVAAVGLMLVMVGALITHARRGETQLLVVNVVLFALLAFVAWGRFGPYAFES